MTSVDSLAIIQKVNSIRNQNEVNTMAKIMTVRPPDKLKKKIEKMAYEKGFTLNHLVIQILWEWIEEQEKSSQAGAKG